MSPITTHLSTPTDSPAMRVSPDGSHAGLRVMTGHSGLSVVAEVRSVGTWTMAAECGGEAGGVCDVSAPPPQFCREPETILESYVKHVSARGGTTRWTNVLDEAVSWPCPSLLPHPPQRPSPLWTWWPHNKIFQETSEFPPARLLIRPELERIDGKVSLYLVI